MQLPDAVKASRDRFVFRFPPPQGSPGDAFEEQARQWSRRLSQQVQFDTGDPRYGMKNAGGGRPTSKDTLAFDLGSGRIRVWDMLTGTGTGRPTLVSSPDGFDVDGQVFEPQPSVDHVGGGVPVDPDPVDPGTPTTDLVPYIDELEPQQRAIIVGIAGLADAVRGLQVGHVTVDVAPLVAQIDLLRGDVQRGLEAVRLEIAKGVRVRF